MKALIFALTLACAALADTLTVPAPLPEQVPTSSNCEDELDRAKRYDCYRAQRQGPEYRPTMVKESPPAQWATVTSISIHGQDTTRTITIQRAEDWDGTKKDINRFVTMFLVLGSLQLVGSFLLFMATVSQ